MTEQPQEQPEKVIKLVTPGPRMALHWQAGEKVITNYLAMDASFHNHANLNDIMIITSDEKVAMFLHKSSFIALVPEGPRA